MPRVIQPSFFGFSPTLYPKKLTVRQSFDSHTIVFLDYEINSRAQYVMPQDNTPVDILWGTSPVNLQHHYGYVNHYETISDRENNTNTRLVILGTSKVMNTTRPTNWSGVTRTGVAREIARRNRLRSIIHPHDDVLENWTTGTRTDFQSLRSLADETGWRLWVDGATLRFLDPQRLLEASQNQVVPIFVGKQVRRAKILGGSGAPLSSGVETRKTIYGLDYRNNEFFSVTSGAYGAPEQVLPETASTYTEAQRKVDALDRRSNAFYEADFTFTGNATVTPGSIIQVGNTKNVNDLSGYWSVTDVVHTLIRGDFTSEVKAIRKADKSPDILVTTTLHGSPVTQSAVIRDGVHWEAALQEHLNV